jgi:hypothetical protein
MCLDQLIALMAAWLHASRTSDDSFGGDAAIDYDLKLAKRIWLAVVEDTT